MKEGFRMTLKNSSVVRMAHGASHHGLLCFVLAQGAVPALLKGPWKNKIYQGKKEVYAVR